MLFIRELGGSLYLFLFIKIAEHAQKIQAVERIWWKGVSVLCLENALRATV